MTEKDEAIRIVEMFHFPEKEYDIGMELCKRCAIKLVDFYITEHEQWAISLCCAEDFSYSYWERVKVEIEKL